MAKMNEHIDRLREFAKRRGSCNSETVKNITFINNDLERLNIDSQIAYID